MFSNISDKFKNLDDWHHLNKFSLVLVIAIFAAIPITVFGALAVRQLNPQAATGRPDRLTVLPGIKANTQTWYTSSSRPQFSWDCYCYTTKYRVYLKEGNNNFYSGSWYKDVNGGSGITYTQFDSAFRNNNYISVPSTLTSGRRYFWTVACVTGGCNTASSGTFIVDYTAPTAPSGLRLTSTDANGVNLAWNSSSDNVGVGSYFPSITISRNYGPYWQGNAGYISYDYLQPGNNFVSILAIDFAGNRSGYSNIVTVTVPDRDGDGDGFTYSAETFMGTRDDIKCGGANAWPPDFNGDREVDGADQAALGARYSPPATYDRRYDLNLNGQVNSIDQLVLNRYIGRTC